MQQSLTQATASYMADSVQKGAQVSNQFT